MDSKKSQLHLFFLFLLSLSTISFSLPTEFSILNQSPSDDFLSEDAMMELFQQWREKHGKAYKHAGELESRLENFRVNLQYVMETNAQRRGYSVGLNKFADMSNEEFEHKYFSKIKKPVNSTKKVGKEEGLLTCDVPNSLDWREKGAVTDVKDQGNCGSSWAFSATGAIEGINAITTGDLISLSERELVDCDKTKDVCEGGFVDYGFQFVMDNGGIDMELGYPYTGLDGKCNTAKKDTKIVTIDGYEDLAQTENALFCAVHNQPVSVGIQGSSWDFQLYTGGVYDGDCSSDPGDINHAVLIVGYASSGNEDYWMVKNSWGTGWGIEGYAYMKRNTDLEYGVCAINAMASYPTKEAASPPLSPSALPLPFVWCGLLYTCPTGETCCCTLSIFGWCVVYGCCHYEQGVCCTGSSYCCPHDYICDIKEGRCLLSHDDNIGIPAQKIKAAKHKLPWTKFEEMKDQGQRLSDEYQPLEWKKRHLASVR